ncbi:MAG: cell division protein ZapA [Prevotella sp.]|nr:cell division protein ZapA [Prevotella sp.]MCF0207926.1 cell division protein ZapA [Bacteroidaceae bacterium]
MNEDKKITIRLTVYGIIIPVVVSMKDEPLYRNAAKNINATIANYTQLFADKKQEKEILAMAMIDIALRYEQERANKDVEVYNDILSSLTKEVEQVL